MDLRFTDEENAFREEVRAFLKEKMPEDIRKRMADGESMDKDDLVRWTRILAEKGWAAPHWPVEHGGTSTYSWRRRRNGRRRSRSPSASTWSGR